MDALSNIKEIEESKNAELKNLLEKYQDDIKRVKNDHNERMISKCNEMLDEISVEKDGLIRKVKSSNIWLACAINANLTKALDERKKINSK